MMDDKSSMHGMIYLDSANYAVWKTKMEDILYVKDLYEPILNESMPTGQDESKWKILNRKAVGTIRQFVDVSVLQHISNDTNAYELWMKLEAMYERKNALSKASLMRKLVKLEFHDGNSMVVHLNDFQGLINQLSAVKMSLDDELQALLLLSSLPERLDTLFVSLSNSAPDGKLTMESVKASLLNEETRRKEIGSSNYSEAHYVAQESNRGRSKNRPSRGRDNSRDKSKSKGRIICHYCDKPGHIKRFCRKMKRDKSKDRKGDSSESKSEEKNTTALAISDDDLLFIGDKECLNVAGDDCNWAIDSSASYHLTSHQDYFSSYTSGDFGSVRMGNDGSSRVVGKGTIYLESSTGCKLILRNVRHVPDIRLNLISIGRLDEEGYFSHFNDGKWKLCKGNLIAARGKKQGSLYMMQAKVCAGEVNVADECSSELWHNRLGHMSEKGMQMLSKKQYLPDVSGMSLRSCVDCLAGKQHRVAFHSRPPSRRKYPLDLVHTDVCSMDAKSHSGALYFVSFIDDYSRKVWVTVLKTKDQVLSAFKEFQARVERETGRKLKVVRADNGGEYRGPFESYCKGQGIKLEKTVPKTPQLNGVAERMNRTIEERIRCMLSHAKLSKSFWAEALVTAVYLINLSPSNPLDGDVPQKVWTGKDVSYKHLRVFGCRAFVHIPRDERSKLDKKTKQCIFLGYSEDALGYKLWDPVDRKVLRSRDVVFFEDQTIEDIEKPKQQTSSHTPINFDPVLPQMTPRVEGGDIQDDDDNIGDDGHDDQPEVEPPVVEPQPQPDDVRRSTRGPRPSMRYPTTEFVLLTDGGEPEDFQEAMSHEKSKEWYNAMQDEMNSLHENHTYDLVKLPNGKRALKNKWVFKLKHGEDGQPPRFKARIVVRGYEQKKGIDFDEIFSPVVKMSSIRVVLSLAASMNLEIEQLDVKTAFLHGDLKEEIYMEQPEGFEVKGKEKLVCRLKKSLYGLKQAPRQWYKKFESFMVDNDFHKTYADHCVFVKNFAEGDFLILLLYVDDMLIVGRDSNKIVDLKASLSKSFAMKDLGPAKQILGMRISRDRKNKKLWISQEKYIEKVLKRFNMNNAKPVCSPLPVHMKLSSKQCPTTDEDKKKMKNVPYSSAVGSLMYTMVCTRPDIAHAVGVVSRFMSNPGKEHWAAVKWILRYLRGTSRVSLCFGPGEPVLDGYTDADMSGDIDSSKSTSGYMMTFAGGAVSWQSKLQKCVALSTTESEYVAAVEAGKELVWMRDFLEELGLEQDDYLLHCDCQSAIHLAKNATYHGRTKHIRRRYHWIRDQIEEKIFELVKNRTHENGSDMLTKILPRDKLEVCRLKAGLVIPPKLE